jgi:penicillin-binding protein 2
MKASRFTAAHQSITFSRRMMLVGGAQAALGGALVARLGYLAVAEHQKYAVESESNRVQLIIVPPRRGWIVDRNNKPIAINRSDFRVDLIPAAGTSDGDAANPDPGSSAHPMTSTASS